MNSQLPTQDIQEILRDTVHDLTAPEIQRFVSNLAQSGVDIGVMKAQGAAESLIEEAVDDVKAQAQSLSKIPGMILAGKQERFLAIAGSVLNTAIGTAFGAARKAIG